jgi:hypothetical protein
MLLDIMATGKDQLVVTRLPLKDSSGKIIGAVGFALFDQIQSLAPLVAKFTRMGEELAATRESLAQARRAKYSFDDFVGHSRQITEVKRQAMLAAPLEGSTAAGRNRQWQGSAGPCHSCCVTARRQAAGQPEYGGHSRHPAGSRAVWCQRQCLYRCG